MSQATIDLWNQALDKIRRELPEQAYETWFLATRAVDLSDDTLAIEVPNPFVRDWIASHYTELIQQALFSSAGRPVRLEYRIAPIGAEPETLVAADPAPAAPEIDVREAVGSRALNPRYTFDQFVIGPANRFSHAAALAVAESPAKVYNPLFIYGRVGLGKTHLMQAIGHHLQQRFPKSKSIYISSEQFTNLMITALQNRSMGQFRDRFRSADVLMIDDVHFLSGKEATQEAFFHTFNALYDAHRQIVISSDRPPKEIRGLEERLVSRFEWGLVTDVQPPDLETRIAILRKKAAAQGQSVPDTVTGFIAERVTSNIRELEGALNRVIAYAVLINNEISLAMAQEILRDMVAESQRLVTIDRIQQVVADHFSVSVKDLKGKRRDRAISVPRQIAMAISRRLTESSLPAIGEAFGGRDHATVLYACQKLETARKKQEPAGKALEKLLLDLSGGC
ncbi:MAG: chromosomal replication initiator protein DnaA [Candidatus Omnitrophica bacterium CG11_big_fil_rev_8_21_14_0_20_64_10]|nr:MAG: chromosomal replication initiator protein DnaA [Candidatus Omnitrophica bacterium CG11_big_fil_rev_8_21_14_0_20_64_10]